MDEVANVLYAHSQAISSEIEVKENLLKQQESANKRLLSLLVKSKPVKVDDVLPDKNLRNSFAIHDPSFCLPLSSADWQQKPVQVLNQWAYVIRQNLIIGAEIINNSQRCLVCVQGTCLTKCGNRQSGISNQQEHGKKSLSAQYAAAGRSVLLQFSSTDGLIPKEVNVLRSGESAYLMVANASPNLFLSTGEELILVCELYSQIGDETDLLLCGHPGFQPDQWRLWQGEIVRINTNIFVSTDKTVVMNELGPIFSSTDTMWNEISKKRLVASLYSCQIQRMWRLECADAESIVRSLGVRWCQPEQREKSNEKLISARNALLRDVLKLPLADGVHQTSNHVRHVNGAAYRRTRLDLSMIDILSEF